MNGKKEWFIPDGYMSDTERNGLVSHEAICILNLSGRTAHVEFTFYFEDREPLGGFSTECLSDRTNHYRLDKAENIRGERVPKMTPYAVFVKSDEPIIVQASRLDVSQPEYALMTTIAY